MDTIVHAAIEEICSKGVNGVSLPDLFDRLQPSLSAAGLQFCAAVKRAVWSGLVGVKGIQFLDGDSGFDLKSKSFEECEVLDLMLVADEQLRRCFVGLYDVKASNITTPQQRVLELLAEARGNGITQDELCRRLHIPANNFFYVVKRLESWGLVVRQSTIKRTKEAPVRTNLIRLHRYAVPLGSQQRLEITKDSKNLEDNLVDNVAGGYCMSEQQGQDDVLVKDFLPALKAVCDRLEQSEGKVLVVSDIKRELGYREVAGHRAWRNICKRLTQAGLIEVFEAKVDHNEAMTPNSKRSKSRGQNKAVQCLRLLKTFSPRLLEKRTPDCEHDNLDSEQPKTFGNHIQNTEQLVELPLEQQIYDMIDREGSKGLLGVEVCRRLGITTKMFDNLNSNVIRRFGLHQLSENRKRGSAYRFWTRDSFNLQLPNSPLCMSEDGPDEHALGLSPVGEPSSWENVQKNCTDVGSLTLERCIEQQLKDCPQEDRGSCEMVVWSKASEDLIPDKSITLPVSDTAPETNSNLVVYSSSPVLKPLNLQHGQRYPSVTSTQREQRIIERLKTEKIILKPELQRWLESFEKDNQTRMDRKTLSRLLRNLKKEGHCKTMVFNVPDVTNYSHLRDIFVILHPSVDCSHGELSNQVVDRQRSFEMQIRGAAAQSKKEVHVPVLHGIQRIGNKSNSDAPSVKSELMRANGFVLAKMVRTKLVHQFLWRYVNKLGDCNEALNKHAQSRNLHSSCLLFDLEVALKGMPLELFLQVVGSVLNMKDMTEKCKDGLLLSDLPQEEYKSLMNTRATGRLSWLIDILRRLRLIQLVADDSKKDAAESSHARLIYALELKPYIEEPPSVDLLHRGLDGLDLRPHYRHDFILSTSKAVHKYWQTLEYCYAAADAKAALHAFPGSVVNEVCFYKSWTTVRVMTAEQRSELFKRVKDQPNKKLTFQECRVIAKDLKLSLEQVLRVYYDHRQKRLSRVQGDLDVQGVDLEARSGGHRQSRRKRKTSPPRRRTKRANTSHTIVEEPCEDGVTENMEEPGVTEQEEHHESIPDDRGAIPMLIQSRQPKFSWTEDADRLLIIQYARQRAIQGARRGTDWASISELPAPPLTCRKRIAILNTDMKFRESLIRLCDLLSKRYARLHYEGNLMNKGESSGEPDPHGSQWDDFSESEVRISLHEVLIHKMQKVDTSKRIGSEGSQNRISNTRGFEKDSDQQQKESSRRARPTCLSQKFVKHLKEGYSIARRSTQSLAVASAVELFKLAFLTTSKSTEMPNLLAETIGRYSDHDRYSAFDYLREKKIMVGCGPSQPFVLSQNFLRCLSASQFPANTGKRASKSASWLHKKGKELMEGKVNLPEDLQCGDIFFLFSLVSSGELSVSPLLPDEGVGEAEDSRSTKRKYDDHELEDYGAMIKKSKYDDRRDKGFPGIKVSVNRATISRPNIVEFLKHGDKTLLFGENDSFYNALGEKEGCTSSTIDYVKESSDLSSIIPATVIYGDSKWEVMASYTMQYLLQHSGQAYAEIHPDLIENSHKAIQNAGDEGLSISKFSYYTGIKDTILAECIIDVLQLFGHVLKVNGYNSIHIVEGGYRTKYFLTSKATRCQDPESERSVIPQTVNGETNVVQQIEDAGHVTNCMNVDEVHRVTVLNLSEDVTQHLNPMEVHDEVEGCSQIVSMSSGGSKETQNFDVSAAYLQPILPWVNGDGTINGIVYRGLTRRILGIVIQHPGILEGEIIRQMEVINSQIQMEVLNPQSCRRLLSLMVLDKHLIVRRMTQGTSSGPPALLVSLIGKHSKKATFISRKHYFANPTSASLL